MQTYGATLALCIYLGWGIATSPLPMAGIAVMLLADRPQRTAAAFTAAWFACQLLAITVVTVGAHYLVGLDLPSRAKEHIAVALLVVAVAMIVLGAVLALRARRAPTGKSGAHTRAFIRSAESAGPREAAGMAVATSLLNVTNLPYWAGIGILIERSKLPTDDRVSLVLVSAVAASLTFLLITFAFLVMGGRLTHLLQRGRDLLLAHAGGVVPAFFLTSGAVLALIAMSDLGWL